MVVSQLDNEMLSHFGVQILIVKMFDHSEVGSFCKWLVVPPTMNTCLKRLFAEQTFNLCFKSNETKLFFLFCFQIYEIFLLFMIQFFSFLSRLKF